jgi:hypothetical protein
MGMHIARSATFKNNVVVDDDTFKDFLEKKVAEKDINKAIVPYCVYDCEPKIKFNKEELIRILEAENRIRLSRSFYSLYDIDISKFYELDEHCITQALRVCDYNPDEDDSLKAYRVATMEYINDLEVREKVVWMKYDKARLGNFKIGEEVTNEDIILHDLQGCNYAFKDLLSNDKPNLIVAGSIS